MIRFAVRLPLFVLLGTGALSAQSSPTALTIAGQGGAAKSLSFAELRALPQAEVVAQ